MKIRGKLESDSDVGKFSFDSSSILFNFFFSKILNEPVPSVYGGYKKYW